MPIRVEYLGTYPIDSICKEFGSSIFILIEDEDGKRICHQDTKGKLCETGITVVSENKFQIRKLFQDWAKNN